MGEIDLFEKLFKKIEELTGARPYTGKYAEEDTDGVDTSYRIVADHIRTITFAISDGVLPSNVGRGYVIRRIIRRAVCSAVEILKVPADSGFFSNLAPTVVELMGDAFPGLKENIDNVVSIINDEEIQFGRTLRLGLKRFDKITKGKESGYTIPGEESAKLFHTYGFPFDLTRQKASARGFKVDKDAHKKAMEENAGVVAAGAKKMDLLGLHGEAVAELVDQSISVTDDSIKYNPISTNSKLVAIWCGRKKGFYEYLDKSFYVECSSNIDEENPKNLVGLIFDKTPFYAEQGGQIYDIGTIKNINGGDFTMDVVDVQVSGGFVVHYGTPKGAIKIDDILCLTIDESRRSLVTNNHTSTHLCNYALRNALGDHVDQQGSLVLENRLRFDFSHGKPITGEELEKVDSCVKTIIQQNLGVFDKEVPLAQAKSINGVRQMFGETYPDPVRVVSVGVSVDDLLANPENEEWSKYAIEFCGGTHVKSSSSIGCFTTISEEGISKGVRRIVCLTGSEAQNALKIGEEFEERLNSELEGKEASELSDCVATLLKDLDSEKLFPYCEKLRLRKVLSDAKKRATTQLKELEKAIKAKATSFSKEVCEQLSDNSQTFFVSKVEFGNNCGLLKTTIKNIQKTHSIPIILISTGAGDKVAVVATSPKDKQQQLPANKWVSNTVSVVNGKGGGKPDGAQGVCNNVSEEQVQSLLNAANEFASSSLNA